MSLKKLLGEELYKQVMERLDDDTELIVNDGSYLPREKLNEKTDKIEMLEKQLEDAKGQISERDKQLEQLKNDSQASDELKKRIEELESQNKQTAEEYESQIKQQEKEYQQELEQQKFNNALEIALRDADAKNVKAVKSLLDTENIKIDGDKLLGLEDQLNTLKENDSYLFGKESLKGQEPNKSGGNPEPKPDFNEMSDEEYFNYREKNEL